MKRLVTLLISFSLTMTSQVLASEVPGLMEQKIDAPHHDRKMNIAIWYPATEGAIETFAENAVFQGGEVRRDAALPLGKHPIVLLSHGMGGSYLSLNWLASGLANKGAIVVGVNHPNGWFRDRHPEKMFNHWSRVQDLQAALDHVLNDQTLADAVDPNRIYATGFSFGGWTALSIGGATASADGSIAYCKAAGERSHNCMDLKHFGYDPAKIDPAKWAANWKDDRIKSVVSIDPGLTWSMTPDNVKELDQTNLMIIGLGNSKDRHYATDTTSKGSGMDQLVPQARIEVMDPATHFTAMPLCKPEGVEILASEKDDPVCTDPAGTDRKAAHDKIISLTIQHFGL